MSENEREIIKGYFKDGPGSGSNLYGLSNGDDGLGFRADGGSGVRFSNNMSARWSNQVDAGIASAANRQRAMLAEAPPSREW